MYGYVGANYFGSQRNAVADEASCPTVEGTLLGAVRRAALAQAGATATQVAIHSRTSRTDRGVHALANVVHLCVSTQFAAGCAAKPPLAEDEWLEAVRAQLCGSAIAVLRRFDPPAADTDVRQGCQKREYRYYVPYRAILPVPLAPAESRAERCVWVCCLPDRCDAAALERYARQRLAAVQRAAAAGSAAGEIIEVSPIIRERCGNSSLLHRKLLRLDTPAPHRRPPQVSRSPHPGSGTIELSDPATAAALAEALDGATDFAGVEPNGLLALLESDAAPRRAVHTRLRDALRLLTGTQSFHNFCPQFTDGAWSESANPGRGAPPPAL